MPRMSDRQSVAANATVENILSGKLHEFLTLQSIVRVSAAAAAVGVNMSVLIGGESICQDQEVSAANRFPIYPDDIVVEGAGFPNDRITISVRNTTGAAIVVQTSVDVLPV